MNGRRSRFCEYGLSDYFRPWLIDCIAWFAWYSGSERPLKSTIYITGPFLFGIMHFPLLTDAKAATSFIKMNAAPLLRLPEPAREEFWRVENESVRSHQRPALSSTKIWELEAYGSREGRQSLTREEVDCTCSCSSVRVGVLESRVRPTLPRGYDIGERDPLFDYFYLFYLSKI